MKLSVGAALQKAKPDHIIRRSYEAYYKGVAKDRFSWDQQRVLYGTQPSFRHLWDLSPTGRIELDQDSVLTFHPKPDKNRAYGYVSDLEKMRAVLTELMLYDPRDK